MSTIVNWYKLASRDDIEAGKNWYASALTECQEVADEYGIDVERIVFAVAALSPGMPWDKNILAVRQVIRGEKSIAYGKNEVKARAILFDQSENWRDHLRGSKVTRFAANILGDDEQITIDKWAYRIWKGTRNLFEQVPSLREKQYMAIACEYREAAKLLGIKPAVLQATTWVTIRRLAASKIDTSILDI